MLHYIMLHRSKTKNFVTNNKFFSIFEMILIIINLADKMLMFWVLYNCGYQSGCYTNALLNSGYSRTILRSRFILAMRYGRGTSNNSITPAGSHFARHVSPCPGNRSLTSNTRKWGRREHRDALGRVKATGREWLYRHSHK